MNTTADIATFTDAQGVTLMDTLRVSTKVYNSSFNNIADALVLLGISEHTEDIAECYVVDYAQRMLDASPTGWVRMGKVVDQISDMILSTKIGRWQGYLPL